MSVEPSPVLLDSERESSKTQITELSSWSQGRPHSNQTSEMLDSARPGLRNQKAPIRLVVIDDHPVVLKGLEALFGAEPDLDLVAACSRGRDGLEAVKRYRPDIVVLDLRMAGLDGLTILRAIKQERPSPGAVVLTADIDVNEALEAVRLGVGGVVLKTMPPQLLMQCIRKVHAGEQWLETQSTRRALATMLQREAGLKEKVSD